MAKRFTASSDQLTPDAKFDSKLVSKFINCMMWAGKKSTAQRVFYDAMDIIGGVDALVMCDRGMVNYHLACRVQYGRDYRTHTLRICRGSRLPVEWQRGLYRRLKSASGPDYTIQAYVTDHSVHSDILSFGVVKTDEYFDYVCSLIDEGRQLQIQSAIDAGDGPKAWFAAIRWPIPVASFWKWVNRVPQNVFKFCN